MEMPHNVLRIDGPALIFGGPYSNLQATEALLTEARRLGIPPERTICTGDVVAYCGDPRATAELVRDAGIHAVMGNCEESLAAAAGDCGCGFAPGSACERLSAAWFALADREIDPGLRRWMADLPRRIDIEIGERRLAVIHGGCW
jgi:predicted phosphodiesterase